MTPSHRLRLLLLPALAVLAIPATAAAKSPTASASYIPGEVVVRYQRSADRAARDLGQGGPDFRYGAGLLDAARAVTP